MPYLEGVWNFLKDLIRAGSMEIEKVIKLVIKIFTWIKTANKIELRTSLKRFTIQLRLQYSPISRECVSTGAAGAQTRRSLGHHLFHPQILRLLVLLKPPDFET